MKRVAVFTVLSIMGVAVGAGGVFALLGGRPTEEEVARLEAGARDRSRAEGYEEGQAAGFLEGEDTGYQRGEAAGYQQGLEEGREQGRSEGQDEGYAAGYQDGQDDLLPFLEENQDAYEEGWQAGYEAGCLDAGGNVNIFGECLEPFTLPPIP